MKSLVFVALLSSLVLTACMGKDAPAPTPTPPAPTPTNNTPTTATPAKKDMVESGSLVSVDYTLSVDGKIIETSKMDTAQSAGLYQSGITYRPLEFIVGAGAMIKGFDAGVTGMKLGEKKTITVAPADGYGAGPVEKTINKALIAPTFSITQDIAKMEDTVNETVPKEALGEDGKDLTVGKKITGGNGVTAEVLSIDGDKVTLKIDNAINPFYKKPRTVGSTAEQGDFTYTIKAINGTGVTIDVVNKTSPFAGKEFAPGSEVTTPAGTVKIKAVNGDTVTIDFTHPLAGKTLTFDVEVKDIK